MTKVVTDSNKKQLSANRPKANWPRKDKRWKAMLWSMAFIVVAAMALPIGSYVLHGISAAQAQDDDSNQRANFWRAVREGNTGYSAVSGAETNVLINNGGQNWRQMRNGPIATYGGWMLLGVVTAILLFFAIRGSVKLDQPRSGQTVPRWNIIERTLHWFTAICFVLLTITGLSMFFGRAVLIPILGSSGFAFWANLSINIHNKVGPFFSGAVVLMFLFWVRHNIPNAIDVKWFAQGGGIIGKAHPSAEKANAGEKVWFWVVILIGLVCVCVSGLALMGWLGEWGVWEATRANMQTANIVHSIAAMLWIAMFLGHVYIGTIGSEGSLEAMTTGRVSVEWAKQHHDLWYEEVKDDAASTGVSAAMASAVTSGGADIPPTDSVLRRHWEANQSAS